MFGAQIIVLVKYEKTYERIKIHIISKTKNFKAFKKKPLQPLKFSKVCYLQNSIRYYAFFYYNC